jgi:DNA modification methylase
MKAPRLDLNYVYNMDCLEGMKWMPDGSIDMIVADFYTRSVYTHGSAKGRENANLFGVRHGTSADIYVRPRLANEVDSGIPHPRGSASPKPHGL